MYKFFSRLLIMRYAQRLQQGIQSSELMNREKNRRSLSQLQKKHTKKHTMTLKYTEDETSAERDESSCT